MRPALFVITLFAAPLLAAPGPKADPKSDKPASEMIRKALDSSGNFDFSGVNLAGVVNTLNEQYKINIVIDRTVIQQMGFEPEVMNVELKMKEGKLRSALKGILGQYNLTHAIVGDTLLITTEEMAVYRQLKQHVSIDFDGVPLNKALKEISSKYGVNIVLDPRAVKAKTVENPVTLQVEDVPFEAAVRLMCEMADLKPARMGNVIYVTTEARADKLKDGDHLVPAPPMINPLAPGANLGGLGGGIAGAAVPPVAIPEKPESKDDAPKKE